MAKEVLKLALEALEFNQARWQGKDEAITAIKEALAQQALDRKAENARELGLDYDPKQEPCGGCGGSGWVPRDPDIGTDQECFVCGGSGAQPKEPEQEPVAWHTEDHLTDRSATTYSKDMVYRWQCKGWPVTPLYTTPPQRKPLTDEEIGDIAALFYAKWRGHEGFARAIEAAHGIKENT